MQSTIEGEVKILNNDTYLKKTEFTINEIFDEFDELKNFNPESDFFIDLKNLGMKSPQLCQEAIQLLKTNESFCNKDIKSVCQEIENFCKPGALLIGQNVTLYIRDGIFKKVFKTGNVKNIDMSQQQLLIKLYGISGFLEFKTITLNSGTLVKMDKHLAKNLELKMSYFKALIQLRELETYIEMLNAKNAKIKQLKISISSQENNAKLSEYETFLDKKGKRLSDIVEIMHKKCKIERHTKENFGSIESDTKAVLNEDKSKIDELIKEIDRMEQTQLDRRGGLFSRKNIKKNRKIRKNTKNNRKIRKNDTRTKKNNRFIINTNSL